MVEGGLLSWKRQKVKKRGPTADYSCLKLPLPLPPKGTKWQLNTETKEWTVVAIDGVTCSNSKKVNNPREMMSNHDNNNDNHNSNNNDNRNSKDNDNNNNEDDNNNDSSSVTGQVLNLDYCEHVVLETDTFLGICLAYKISATKLRQANMFSGSNLRLAPAKLIVPLHRTKVEAGLIRMQDKNSLEYKTALFLAELPTLRQSEAKFYLDMNDLKLEDAIRHAKEDLAWENTRQARDLRRNDDDDDDNDHSNHHHSSHNAVVTADRAIPVDDTHLHANDDDEYQADLELIPLVNDHHTPKDH